MSWLVMALFFAVFIALAVLTGESPERNPSDARRRMRERLAHGGFPPESWEV